MDQQTTKAIHLGSRPDKQAQMILLSIGRKTVPEVADIFETCCATARFWIHRFNAEGPVGLFGLDLCPAW